jgi:hypothetical protein
MPCPSPPTHIHHHHGSRTSSGRASAGRQITWRGVTSSASPPLRSLALLCLQRLCSLTAAAAAPLHPPTLHAQQATPVRTKVTARPRLRPITPPTHTRVPEPPRCASCVVPACCRLCLIRTSAAGQHSTAPGRQPLTRPVGLCDRHASSVAAPHSHTAYSCCCRYCCLRPLLCVPRCAATPPLPRDTSHLPAVATTIVVTVAGIIHASRRHKPVCPYPVFGDVPATEPDRPSLLECAFQKENRTLAGAVSAQKRSRKWTRAIP